MWFTVSHVLGAVYLAFFLFFLIITLPIVNIYRIIVILLAKVLRPDLDEILTGLSVMFACDLFANATAPRSNVVVTMIFKNQQLCKDFKSVVMKKWFEGCENRKTYKKFSQYPVKWLGFSFWKNNFHNFSIDNHVIKLFGKECVVTEDQLNHSIEKLLNSALPMEQSPWKLYVIESYQPYQIGEKSSIQSAILCVYHHTLADGFTGMSALTKLFDGQLQLNFPKDKYAAEGNTPCQRFNYWLMSPINTIIEGIWFFSHIFITCPWKVADENKKWHQVVVRTEPIPLERIKNIKNTFGVSFTSVLLAAVSASIYKCVKENDEFESKQGSVLCMSVLPVPIRSSNDALSNEMAAAFLDIPSSFYRTPVERLWAVNEMLQRKKSSVFPYMSRILPNLVGTHLFPVCRSIFYNKTTPFAISNVPGFPGKFELNGNPVIDNGFQLGGAPGVTGVTITAMSHHQSIRIAISVEQGLMSREKAQQFVNGITDEIQLLQDRAIIRNTI